MVKKSGLIFSRAWKYLTSLDWNWKKLAGYSTIQILRWIANFSAVWFTECSFAYLTTSSLNLIVFFLCFTRRFWLGIVTTFQEQTKPPVQILYNNTRKCVRHSRSIKNIQNSAIHRFFCNCGIIRILCGLCQTRGYQTHNTGLLERPQ